MLLGMAVWVCLVVPAVTLAGREVMTGIVVLLGGITLFAAIVTLIDGIAYRRRLKQRKN